MVRLGAPGLVRRQRKVRWWFSGAPASVRRQGKGRWQELRLGDKEEGGGGTLVRRQGRWQELGRRLDSDRYGLSLVGVSIPIDMAGAWLTSRFR
ncbi:hypothetical protein LINPERHAP2_LOCUS37448 [Linum perenne]